jgi:hypothetical protein
MSRSFNAKTKELNDSLLAVWMDSAPGILAFNRIILFLFVAMRPFYWTAGASSHSHIITYDCAC